MSREEFIAVVAEQARAIGSQKEAARLLGVSQQYLGDVLHGRREPGVKIVSAMKFQRIVQYEPLPK